MQRNVRVQYDSLTRIAAELGLDSMDDVQEIPHKPLLCEILKGLVNQKDTSFHQENLHNLKTLGKLEESFPIEVQHGEKTAFY